MSEVFSPPARRSIRSRLLIAGCLLGGFLVGIPVGAAVATTYSSWVSFGNGHHVRAYTVDSSGTPIGGSQVEKANGSTSPTGYLGGAATLQRSTASCATVGMTYNTKSLVRLIVKVEYDCGSGNYRTSAVGSAYNPNTGNYWTTPTPTTPYQYVP
ncbi:hypothetical protein [Microbacterium sp. PA5]|uniref:hypothetical protein n=1 Tax=Microbacterium sp. PA5 TaxID=3416654 RepID=UPI003CF004DF